MKPPSPVLVLAYASCDTCRKAIKYLSERGVAHTVRPIVEAPPTPDELARWIPASGLTVRQWLNTSGQSYRALGKAAVDAMSDDAVRAALAADGKLVKRPILALGARALVGFNEAEWLAALG